MYQCIALYSALRYKNSASADVEAVKRFECDTYETRGKLGCVIFNCVLLILLVMTLIQPRRYNLGVSGQNVD